MAGNPTSRTNAYGIAFGETINAANQVTSVTSSWSDSQHPGTLASSITYEPSGTVSSALLGNGLTESFYLNNRFQPCRANVNSSSTVLTACTASTPSGNLLDLAYSFNYGSANNGNLASLTAAGQQSFGRSYSYDALNRLSAMSAPGDTCSGLSWTYDAWGNRNAQSATGGTCNTFSATAGTNNRLGSPYTYDNAGNMTYDGSHSYYYDGENRLIQVDGSAGYCSTSSGTPATACYVYDAEGNRVQKTASGLTTTYVFDPSNQVDAEYWSSCGTCWAVGYINLDAHLTAIYKNDTTYFIHSDDLGSTRLMTAMDKSVYDNMDYLPFGEQISGDTGTTHKFTSKERDSETALDQFGARYYSSAMGRFTIPDWAAKATAVPYANFGNPQSLNLYSYVQNNPTTLGDPDGHATGVDDFIDLAVGGGIIVGYAVTAYLEQPSSQKSITEAIEVAIPKGSADIRNDVESVFSHPWTVGGDITPPPRMTTSAPAATTPGAAVGETPAHSVALPSDLVGTQDKDSGMQGKRYNNGPLDPTHGGVGDAAKDFDTLTGGKSAPAGSRYPSGTLLGDNKISFRPATDRDGPRIDIPANGDKPPETLHYPKEKTIWSPDN